MLYSKAYTVQMNVDVPDAERRVAEKASEVFEQLLSELKLSSEYLELIEVPFAKRQSLDSNEVVENRDILRKYRAQLKERYELVIRNAYNGVALMSDFSTDSTVEELMNSFVASLRELEKQVNYLLSIFSNLNNPDFKDQLLASIDSVKRQSAQVRQLINDRILEHIDTNILAKNWESIVSNRYQEKVNNKEPFIVELYKERKKALR